MGERVTFADLLKKAEEKKKTEVKPKLEAVPPIVENQVGNTPPTPPTLDTSPTVATPATLHTQPTPSTQIKKLPIAPERDFTRVANSIVRDAVRQGIFIGKSKQIYDFLYLKTRGAIQPKRSIRVTKSNLMRGSGIGSERTLLKNLSHLKSVGFIKVTEFDGQHGGNEYEVFLPEETQPTSPTPPTSVTSRQAHYAPQKVESLPPVESNVSGVAQTQQNQEFNGNLKLKINTNTEIDDESASAFSFVIEKLNAVSLELTGKGISMREKDKWESLVDLLILELRTAAKRTGSVSSVPAFLTEVLRRQFFTQRQRRSSTKPSKTKPDTVGKSDSGTYEIKLLDQKGREAALEQLREFTGDDFLDDFKKWYTAEDWIWLMKELEKK
jgi:hypothetical protein